MHPTGRRFAAALSLALLALPLAACGEDEPDPGTQPGEIVEGRSGFEIETGKWMQVLVPAGRLDVRLGEPIEALPEERTAQLTAREAPDGGTFVPLVWSFDTSALEGYGVVFGDRSPLKIELVADGEAYHLAPPTAERRRDAKPSYVAVDGPARDLRLRVGYDGVTQELDLRSGKRDAGRAAGLYDLPEPDPGAAVEDLLEDCPMEDWTTPVGEFRNFSCQLAKPVATPYVVGEWAKPGRTWLAVYTDTTLTAYALSNSSGQGVTYTVEANEDASTVRGKPALGIIGDQVVTGTARGIMVFEVRGDLPEQFQLRRRYELVASGSTGDAPKRITREIGGPVPLEY